MAKTESTAVEGCEEEMAFIADIIKKVGPRLPGSAEERRAAEILKDDISQVAGAPAVMEDFKCATKASIGFIPVIGYSLLFIIVPLSFVFPLFTGLTIGFFLFFALIQIFKYLAWFDVLFPKSRSQNVHAIVEPRSGNAKATIVLGAHIDSSWHCPIIYKTPRQARIKLIYGVVGAAVYGLVLLVRGIMAAPVLMATSWDWWNLVVIPFVPGYYFIAQYLKWGKSGASPGAMDDLAGVAITRWLAGYFREHPDLAPVDCRFVYAFFGCEEAGIKGSHAFVAKHRDGLLAGDCSVILVDGVSDFDYFHVVKGDAWLGSKYDPGLVAMADAAMTSLNIKHDVILNPEGSTDGASFSRAGIKVVTLAAQDPGPASNYHSTGDVPERIDKRTVTLMKKILLDLVLRVGAAHGSSK